MKKLILFSNISKGEPRPVSGKFLKILKKGGDNEKAKVAMLKVKEVNYGKYE